MAVSFCSGADFRALGDANGKACGGSLGSGHLDDDQSDGSLSPATTAKAPRTRRMRKTTRENPELFAEGGEPR